MGRKLEKICSQIDTSNLCLSVFMYALEKRIICMFFFAGSKRKKLPSHSLVAVTIYGLYPLIVSVSELLDQLLINIPLSYKDFDFRLCSAVFNSFL